MLGTGLLALARFPSRYVARVSVCLSAHGVRFKDEADPMGLALLGPPHHNSTPNAAHLHSESALVARPRNEDEL